MLLLLLFVGAESSRKVVSLTTQGKLGVLYHLKSEPGYKIFFAGLLKVKG